MGILKIGAIDAGHDNCLHRKGPARKVLSCLDVAFAMGYIPEIDAAHANAGETG